MKRFKMHPIKNISLTILIALASFLGTHSARAQTHTVEAVAQKVIELKAQNKDIVDIQKDQSLSQLFEETVATYGRAARDSLLQENPDNALKELAIMLHIAQKLGDSDTVQHIEIIRERIQDKMWKHNIATLQPAMKDLLQLNSKQAQQLLASTQLPNTKIVLEDTTGATLTFIWKEGVLYTEKFIPEGTTYTLPEEHELLRIIHSQAKHLTSEQQHNILRAMQEEMSK